MNDCDGCCNKQPEFAKDKVPVFNNDYRGYDTIIITGGEPMLFPDMVRGMIHEIRTQNPTAKIILYTAYSYNVMDLLGMLHYVNGITLTLHDDLDLLTFEDLNIFMLHSRWWSVVEQNKVSLRLNVFKPLDVSSLDTRLWDVREGVEWKENCPLPDGEELYKLEYLF
jgi:hypothetical protein